MGADFLDRNFEKFSLDLGSEKVEISATHLAKKNKQQKWDIYWKVEQISLLKNKKKTLEDVKLIIKEALEEYALLGNRSLADKVFVEFVN